MTQEGYISIKNQQDIENAFNEQNRKFLAQIMVSLHTIIEGNTSGGGKSIELLMPNLYYPLIEGFVNQVGSDFDDYLDKLVKHVGGDDLAVSADKVLEILIDEEKIDDFFKSQELEQEHQTLIDLIAELVVEDEIETYANNFEKLEQVKQLFEYPGEDIIEPVLYYYLGINGGNFDTRIPEEYRNFNWSPEILELIKLAIVKKLEDYLKTHVEE